MSRKRLIPVVSGVVAVVTTGAALAASTTPTLRVHRNVHVDNANFASFAAEAVNKHEAVAVGAAGYSVYTFQGETRHHFICHKTTNSTTNCWAFWPPVSVASATGLSKQTGIKGRLGTVRRGGIRQLTLNGQPLYYFMPDIQSGNKRRANGDELNTFGSIWHVVATHTAAAQSAPAAPTSSGTSSGGSGGYGSGW